VEEDSFTATDPRSGRKWPMTNLVGRFRPDAPCRILLGTHFDTRHVSEEDPDPAKRLLPIPGANDGSSGVAVLLALAPRLRKVVPEGLGVDLALFDGEEMGYPEAGGYCAGSTHFAKRAASLKAKPKFGIILDMVCAPSGVYKHEPNSVEAAPALVESLWAVGASLDRAAFSEARLPPIGDDHVPLSNAGIPSALLIGFEYPQWHTSQDTLAQCSSERLDLIEKVLEEFLKSKAAALAACAAPK
jgi:glutaminyl-peptide cyclotransferase